MTACVCHCARFARMLRRVPPPTPSWPELSRWRGLVSVLVATLLGGIFLLYYHSISSRYDYYTPTFRMPRPLPVSLHGIVTYFVTSSPTKPTAGTNAGPQPWWREVACKMAGHWEDKPGTPLRRLFREVTPKKNNNVFMMDTACNSWPKYRVWCSVESWARQNPTRQVWFLFVSGELAEAELPRVLLQNYPNLHVVGADLNDLFRDTPLLPLFNSRKWAQKDTWPVELLSDMLRVLVLWWWGGVYSDTDVINIRPLTLPLNAVGFEAHPDLGSAFYSFRAHHPILLELMNDMMKHFHPKVWGSIGPHAITRVAERACGKNLALVAEKAPEECPGNLTLYPEHTFYPIPYQSFQKFFDRGGGRDFHKMFNKTFTLHFWNKMSKDAEVKVNSSSIYEVAARNFCPLTFKMATADSDVF